MSDMIFLLSEAYKAASGVLFAFGVP